MFSGIVETMATVVAVERDRDNMNLTLEASFTDELKIDQSVSHNGVCLTVVKIEGKCYTVTAIGETILKSNMGDLKVGDKVNLERSMRPDALLDGHIVQGHVDTTAVCRKVEEAEGSWYFTFEYTTEDITVEKGSITVNGVSLTVVNSQDKSFQVAIIPYTHEHTNFYTFKVGTRVNLEFDIIGKYITRLMSRYLNK